MNYKKSYLAVQLAKEVLAMQDTIDYLTAENERLREFEQKYNDEITAGIKHGETMMVGWMDLLLSDQIKFTPKSNESPTPR